MSPGKYRLDTIAFRVFPFASIFGVAAMLASPATRDLANWLVAENHLVEMLTFLSLLATFAVALLVARHDWRAQCPRWLVGVFVTLAVGAFGTAMEEIAWGQWFLHFASPDFFRNWNSQGETTLHNLRGLHGHSELLRLSFGVAGLLAVRLGGSAAFALVAAPAALGWWFGAITVHALVDQVEDLVSIAWPYDYAIRKSSEVTELVIGLGALTYAGWHWRRRVVALAAPRTAASMAYGSN